MSAELTFEHEFDRRRRLRSLGTPLSLFLLGVLLDVIDFRFSLFLGGRGAGVDIFPDALGLFLITLGVSLIAFRDYFKGALETVLLSVAGFLIATSMTTVLFWFLPNMTLGVGLRLGMQLVLLVAIASVCIAMRSLVLDLGLVDQASWWKMAAMAYVFLQFLPTAYVVLIPGLQPALAHPVFLLLGMLFAFVSPTLLIIALYTTRQAARASFGPQPTSGGTV